MELLRPQMSEIPQLKEGIRIRCEVCKEWTRFPVPIEMHIWCRTCVVKMMKRLCFSIEPDSQVNIHIGGISTGKNRKKSL